MIEGISAVTLGTHDMPRAAHWDLSSFMETKINPLPAFEQGRVILT
jgi:hypothetical protein